MNHTPLLVIFAVLITVISVPAYGELITNHVVINEVDTNPFGDDSLAISEWVELYNPTDSDVDMSGWEIASTTVLKKTFTIPDGTIISPEKHLTFTYAKVWFTDSSESIELRNTSGDVVDKTPLISDLKNDFMSWQRSYDGHTDWEFSLGNAGGSNGKIISSDDANAVEVTLSTDKTNYIFDETAIIQGTVSEKVFVETPSFQSAPILISISGPNFEQSVSLYPDYNLNYETSLDLVQVLGISEGTYDITVNYADVSATTSFSVESEIIETIDIVESAFNISVDQTEYFLKQSILLTGITNEIIPYESMKFTVIDPAGKQIDSGSLFTVDGEFNTTTSINSATPIFGEYVVTAEYGEQIASVKFSLIENIIDVDASKSSNEMILTLDDFQYLENAYVNISGSLPNFDSNSDIYYQVVYLNFYSSDGKPVSFVSLTKDTSARVGNTVPFTSTAVPNNVGEFAVEVRLPSPIFPIGDYVLTANYGGLKNNVNFSVISEKSSESGNAIGEGNPNASIPGKQYSTEEKDAGGYVVSSVKTIIEKTNRISDSLISIETKDKIIEEQSVQPRVLSGSMVTPSKIDISKVNIQVSSESGVCIIGQNFDCLVNESTRKPGQIFEVIQLDGMSLNVRYSGPDVRLEKFSILPQSSDDFLPDTNWNVEVLKDDEVSRFYYKVTYKTTQ
ncbi:lamin tail domain-containing protein [Nitrosopumilus sp.]|nr:lamin tail domain-containing protein [Nitrosopumilus sp.]